MSHDVHVFREGSDTCQCHGKTQKELHDAFYGPTSIPEIPLAASFWVPTTPEPEPEPELTPIPQIKRRACYVCGNIPATARARNEPAYCEEHRSKR
jgi:hypothetical protein